MQTPNPISFRFAARVAARVVVAAAALSAVPAIAAADPVSDLIADPVVGPIVDTEESVASGEDQTGDVRRTTYRPIRGFGDLTTVTVTHQPYRGVYRYTVTANQLPEIESKNATASLLATIWGGDGGVAFGITVTLGEDRHFISAGGLTDGCELLIPQDAYDYQTSQFRFGFTEECLNGLRQVDYTKVRLDLGDEARRERATRDYARVELAGTVMDQRVRAR